MLKMVSVAACAAAILAFASAEADTIRIRLEPVVTGLNSPVALVRLPGDGDRMLVAEQWGRVILVEDGEIAGTFLDIRDLIVDQYPEFDERGLLGLAIHPDFASNGKFYVAYSGAKDSRDDLGVLIFFDHSNYVVEFSVSSADPDIADPGSGRVLSSIPWPQFNHNGHWIDFGPDGLLYLSTGDGGNADDWGAGHNKATGNGQDLASPHGKILRLDPETGAAAKGNPFASDPGADPRIWATGFRNPWRCSFDMGGDHELFCGDVGQNSFEEVDIVTKGGNYGWRVMEGAHCFDFNNPNDHLASCDNAGMTPPILEYKNCGAQPDGCKGISVTGGYVYRGGHKAWDGAYIFGDWSRNFGAMNGVIMIGAKGADGTWTLNDTKIEGMKGEAPYILAFAQDAAGEVYALTSTTTGPAGGLDTIYKIAPGE